MRAGIGALAFALATATASASHAADPEPIPGEPAPEIRTHRTFGFGIGGGVGAQAFLSSGLKFGGAVLLPAIELQFFPFRRRDFSIDVTFPLWNTIYNAIENDAIFLSIDGYLDFNVGKGNTRLVVGPGVGLSYRDSAGVTGGVRIPFQIGPEFLLVKKHLGVRLLFRPWTELIFAKRDDGGINVGAFAVLVVTGYTTRVSLSDAEP